MRAYKKFNKSKLFVKSFRESKSIFPLFLKVVFRGFIKSGNKYSAYKSLAKLSINTKKECGLNLFKFMFIIFKKILPVLTFKNKHLGKAKYKLPFKNINLTKQTRIASRWVITSVKENKSFKFHEKLSNELLSTFKNSGGIIQKKKSYYTDFFKNRNNIRFLRYIKKK